jgi:A/G-specific adenine glycosylase
MVPRVIQIALLLHRDGSYLVRRRPLAGMLGGLWEFPGGAVSDREEPQAAAVRLLREFGGEGLEFAGGVDHAYSHFRLDLHLYRAQTGSVTRVAEGEESRWLPPADLAAWPLHGAHKKALPLLATETQRCREKQDGS